MDQLNQLKGIILITECIIEDQKLIKDVAENLHHEIKYLEPKHDELKDILIPQPYPGEATDNHSYSYWYNNHNCERSEW